MEWHFEEFLAPQELDRYHLAPPALFPLPLVCRKAKAETSSLQGFSSCFAFVSGFLLQTRPQVCPDLMRKVGSAGAIRIPGKSA